MATCIVYVGEDTCHRIPVLVAAGYTVEQLRLPLRCAESLGAVQAEAVLFTQEAATEESLQAVRSSCDSPLIVFRQSHSGLIEAAFDLVVRVLEPPEAWLVELKTLIEKRRRRGSRLPAEEVEEPDAAKYVAPSPEGLTMEPPRMDSIRFLPAGN